jgi:hypothetical protein
MHTFHVVLFAGLLGAGAARAQLLERPAPAQDVPSRPFAQIQPVSRLYMGNAAETDGVRFQDKSAFGVYTSDPRLFAGIGLSPLFAVEAGYANLYTRGFHFADYARPDEVNGALGTRGYNSYLAGRIDAPVNDRFVAYGTLGVAVSERVAHDGTARATVTESDVGPYVGTGGRYRLDEKASLSARYEQYGNSAKKWGGETNNSGVTARFRMGF